MIASMMIPGVRYFLFCRENLGKSDAISDENRRTSEKRIPSRSSPEPILKMVCYIFVSVVHLRYLMLDDLTIKDEIWKRRED